jgi:hypothetical protein
MTHFFCFACTATRCSARSRSQTESGVNPMRVSTQVPAASDLAVVQRDQPPLATFLAPQPSMGRQCWMHASGQWRAFRDPALRRQQLSLIIFYVPT